MNTQYLQKLEVAAIATLCLSLVGCATAGPPPPSGFLETYEGMRADPTDESLLWWERDGFEWTRYRGLILEPIAVYYHPEATTREIRPDELKKLTDAFREAVTAELGDKYRITDEPASDVLRIRCAITDVIPVRPALNAAASLVAFVAVDVGGAAIEVEFLDSQSGERLAAGIDQKLGRRVDGVAGITRLGQARRAFEDWAHELRAALDTNP